MKFTTTKSGGRIAQGNTLYGTFYVEWDNTGKLVKEEITIIMPDVEIDDSKTIANDRLNICNDCPDKLCPVKHKTKCQMNTWLAKPMACCPADPPRWYPIQQ